MQMDDYIPGDAGSAIAAYHDGTTFTRDFWQEDRVGAMAGALVEVYNEANLMLGMTGAASARGADNYVVKPGPFDRWSDATTSPGPTPTRPSSPVSLRSRPLSTARPTRWSRSSAAMATTTPARPASRP